ncbi:MAG: CvpA family protein [Candidatus Auribacter fodinae]|jgi:membrane protein required for colicin V production|uniref:CvpA family protein n=1 Tax=Candidatus Auribacter fodinae TaxID=2093366 RepID=A0A3A4R4F0_9BACT|nr:MAG: CvpA family protein [Candidatus Auribacter fodinae]
MNIVFGWLDLLVILVLVFFGIRGYKRGLSGELLRVIGLIASFTLAYQFFGMVGEKLSAHSSIPEQLGFIIGYILVFALVFLFFVILRIIVQRMMTYSFVDALEKGGGVAAGLMKALFMLSIIYVLLGMLHIPPLTRYIVTKSFTGQYIIRISPYAYNAMFYIWKPAKGFEPENFFTRVKSDIQR